MKNFLRRFIIAIGAILILLLLFSVIATWLFSNRLGQQIVDTVNQQITSELLVDRFDLDVIRSFPNISANMKGITLKDNKGGSLIEAERLSCALSLWALINKEIEIQSITFKDGVINLMAEKNGAVNYEIFAADGAPVNATTTQSDQTIQIDQANIQNMEVRYVDRAQAVNAVLAVEEGTLSGAFSSVQFTLHNDFDVLIKELKIGKDAYLTGQPAQLKGDIEVDLNQQSYQLDGVALTLNNNTFQVKGLVETRNEESYLDIELRNEDGSLAELSSLFPLGEWTGFDDLESGGDFLMVSTIKGIASAEQQPSHQRQGNP